jgi:phage shock protein C
MKDMNNNEEPKRLYRSQTNRVFAGVIGGLGEFLNIDPVVLRLIWVLIVVFTAVIPGILAYLIVVMIVPNRPVNTTSPPPPPAQG